MKAIFRRELSSYFTGLSGYVFGAFLLLFAGIYTMAYNIRAAVSNFEYVLSSMSFIFLVIVPILTMRVFAEEKRQKTDQLLYSLPLTMTEVVMGKYLAMLVMFLIPLCIIGIYPAVLSHFGKVNLAAAYGRARRLLLPRCGAARCRGVHLLGHGQSGRRGGGCALRRCS